MFRATEVLSGSVAERMSQVAVPSFALAETIAQLLTHHRDGRSSELRRGAVVGLIAKREDNRGILIVANRAANSAASIVRDAAGNVLECDLDDLAQTMVAMFRSHPHIKNILTHRCGGKWEQIGQALGVIFNPLATLNDLSPLA